MKTVLLLLFVSSIYASQTISFHTQEKKIANYQKFYTVRFLSVPETTSNNEILKYIPQELRKETHLVKSGKYMTATYRERKKISEVYKDLDIVKKAGYKDAYIRSFTKQLTQKIKPEKSQTKSQEKSKKTDKISKHSRSNMIYKANMAYKDGEYMKAIIYYEMLLASGNSNLKIEKNLCYLYGRIGAFSQLEELLSKTRHSSKLIYAYAYGAAITGQENFNIDVLPYAEVDRSGRLLLLSGYYYEQKGQKLKALEYYKMAYKRNPSDSYNLFAFARAQDALKNTTQDLSLYKKLRISLKDTHPLYETTSQRIYQLGE
jgi:tetratricopeptide (TPR) repeat protein